MKKHFPYFLITGAMAAMLSCQQPSSLPSFTDLPVPCKAGGMPNLHPTTSGMVLLSWIDFVNDTTDALVFSALENGRWGPPKTVATGSDWFVNWADFPSLAASADDEKSLAAHWLQKSAGGTYDYDVRISQSPDGGQNWNESFIIHKDGVQAEHGFVSLLPLPDGRIFAMWLDGRNTKLLADSSEKPADNSHDHGHGGGGPMTLRCAAFDKTGRLSEEAELDNKVCDCCQTAAAMTSRGPIVAYRDRSDEEYRDIYYVRWLDKGMWSTPSPVFKDKWHITGCPVNGPALAADGETVALAWFTGAGEKPQVKVAFSADAGENFGTPVRVDEGAPLGRVDILLLSKEKALICWMETAGDAAAIKAMEIDVHGKMGKSFLVAPTSPSRSSGFPRMEKSGGKVIFAWTEVSDNEPTKIRSAMIAL